MKPLKIKEGTDVVTKERACRHKQEDQSHDPQPANKKQDFTTPLSPTPQPLSELNPQGGRVGEKDLQGTASLQRVYDYMLKLLLPTADLT